MCEGGMTKLRIAVATLADYFNYVFEATIGVGLRFHQLRKSFFVCPLKIDKHGYLAILVLKPFFILNLKVYEDTNLFIQFAHVASSPQTRGDE
jgi:hypothetical protein